MIGMEQAYDVVVLLYSTVLGDDMTYIGSLTLTDVDQ